MFPTADELALRVANLWGILFTDVALVGLVLVLVIAGGAVVLGHAWRERLVAAASVAFVWWFGGSIVATAFVAWAVAFVVAVEVGAGSGPGRGAGRLAGGALLVALVWAPVHWIGELAEPVHARELAGFGTAMVVLRAIAWAAARWRAGIPRPPIARLVVAFFFFPTFMNGPIEPAADLVRPLDEPTSDDVRAGLARLASGAVRIVAGALVFPLDGTHGLGSGPIMPAWQLWLWAVLLYVWFYLSFSAWTEVSIGLARLCGRRDVIENFDAPWLAQDPGDFWRRWHVSLGVWLRDHVYIPLGGNRRHRVLNVFAVFAVSAAWHVWGTLKLLGFGYYPPRAWIGFVTWGALHAVAVSATRRLPPARTPAGVWLRRVATFLFASFAWVPFFTPSNVSWRGMARMLARMWIPVL